MQKLQILFPEPQLSRLREIAEEEDRPVSELVRESVQILISRYPEKSKPGSRKLPTFHAGLVKVRAKDLRRESYSGRSQ